MLPILLFNYFYSNHGLEMVVENGDIVAVFRGGKMCAISLLQQRDVRKRSNTIQMHLSVGNGARHCDCWTLVQRM